MEIKAKHPKTEKSVTFEVDLSGDLNALVERFGEGQVKNGFIRSAKIDFQRAARNHLADHTPEDTLEFMKGWKLGDKAPTVKLSDEEKAARIIDKMDEAAKLDLFKMLQQKIKNK